ncbi:MAG: potassium-transporting ATPase subunit C [Clostridia bacterium]
MKEFSENINSLIDEKIIKQSKNVGVYTTKNNKSRFSIIRASVVALLAFTIICGVIYPISVTLISQAMFPYEANGSVITVTLADGTKKIYGSELIGQQFTEGKYLIGRINLGAPSNLATNSDELKNRVKERQGFLSTLGHTKDIPLELVTSSGSGVDPHISLNTALYQIDRIVEYRNKTLNNDEKLTVDKVKKIIDKYTESRFLFIFGEKTVNVLLVNLALDGLL